MSKHSSKLLTNEEIDSLLQALSEGHPKEESSSIKINYNPVNKMKLITDIIDKNRYSEKYFSWCIADEINHIYKNAGKEILSIDLEFLNKNTLNFSILDGNVKLLTNIYEDNPDLTLNKSDLLRLNIIIQKIIAQIK